MTARKTHRSSKADALSSNRVSGITTSRRVLAPLVDVGDALRREGISPRSFQRVAREVAGVVESDAISLVPRAKALPPFVWFARGAHIPDAPSEVKAVLLDGAANDMEPQSARAFQHGGIQWIAIPLAVDPNELLGALALARRGPPLDAKELAFLSCIAHHLAYALARAVPTEPAPPSTSDGTRRRESELVADAPNILFANLDHVEAVNHLTQIVAKRLDCGCAIEFGSGPDHHRAVAASFADDQHVALTLGRLHPYAQAIGRPIAHGHWAEPRHVTLDEIARDGCLALGCEWLLSVPLLLDPRTGGCLTVFGRGKPPKASAMMQLAARVAQAITNGRLYRDAENAVANRDRLLATVSHDLRNPLGVILMTVNNILAEAPDSDRRAGNRRRLEAIRRSAERMNTLVQDLLELATMESGRFTMHPSAQDVSALVNEVVEAVSAQADATATKLVVEPAPSLPAAWIDRNRIVQVLTNLVGNAIKFAAGTEVRLRAEPCADGIAIAVTDHGPGIDAAELPHVFERFWRSAKTERPGSGLGLAICKAIVDQYGGRIWLESEIGKGTTAVVTVPVVAH